MNKKTVFSLAEKRVKRSEYLKKTRIGVVFSFFLLFITVMLISAFFVGFLIELNHDGLSCLVRIENCPDFENTAAELEKEVSEDDKASFYVFRFGNVGFNAESFKEEFTIDNNRIELPAADNFTRGIYGEPKYLEGETEYAATAIQFLKDKVMPDTLNTHIEKQTGSPVLIAGAPLARGRKLLVSERFATKSGLAPEKIIGGKISLDIDYFNVEKLSHSIELKDFFKDEFTISVFENYEVTGVFNNEYLKYNGNADLIALDENRYKDAAAISYIAGKTIIDYGKEPDKLSRSVTDEGYVFPFLFRTNTYVSAWTERYAPGSSVYTPVKITLAQRENFKAARRFYEKFENTVPAGKTAIWIMGEGFVKINELFNIFIIIVAIFGSLGILIALASSFGIIGAVKSNAKESMKTTRLLELLGMTAAEKKYFGKSALKLFLLGAFLTAVIFAAPICYALFAFIYLYSLKYFPGLSNYLFATCLVFIIIFLFALILRILLSKTRIKDET